MCKQIIGLAWLLLASVAQANIEMEPALNAERVGQAFQITAERIKPTLPQMVDEETLWYDMTAGPGLRVNYFYCIVLHQAHEANAPLLESRIEPLLRSGVCANPGVKLALEQGAVYSYTYISQDEIELVKLEFDRHSCNI